MQVKQRNINLHLKEQLIENGSNQFLASILAARNIGSPDETNYDLKSLLPPSLMHSIESAAEFLYESIKQEKKIIIIGDYDADGATASAVAVLGLRKFLANVDFLVPNRFVYGYGLSEGIVKEAMKNKDLLEVADALTDILYVTYGAGHAFGIDLDKCFEEVQNSNMSKLGEDGKPIYNESGKVMKGPKYFKPDLTKFVN